MSTIPASLIAGKVWASHVHHGAEVHQPHSGCTTDFRQIGTVITDFDASVLGVDYCHACWPGRRCHVCARPSGEFTECGPCTTQAIADEQAYDRGQEWAA